MTITKARLRAKHPHGETFTYCEWHKELIGSEIQSADIDQAYERLPDYKMWLEWYIPDEGWLNLFDYQQYMFGK